MTRAPRRQDINISNIRLGMAEVLWESVTKARQGSATKPPDAAIKAAKELAAAYEDANQGSSVGDMLLEYVGDRPTPRSELKDVEVEFGRTLAMIALGMDVEMTSWAAFSSRWNDFKHVTISLKIDNDWNELEWEVCEFSVASLRGVQRNPAPRAQFYVVRVNRDNSDTYAVKIGTAEAEGGSSLSDAVDLANPDEGDIVEYITVRAWDAGAARLMTQGATWSPVVGIHRNPARMRSNPLPKEPYEVVDQNNIVVGHVEATWLGDAQREADRMFGQGHIAFAQSARKGKTPVGAKLWSGAAAGPPVAPVRHRHREHKPGFGAQRNPAGGDEWIVVRVGRDPRDTHAVKSTGRISADVASAISLANPDDGNELEWGTVVARDGGAARLMVPPGGWKAVSLLGESKTPGYRQNPSAEYQWFVTTPSGKIAAGYEDRADANEFLRDNAPPGSRFKIESRRTVQARGVNPDDVRVWTRGTDVD